MLRPDTFALTALLALLTALGPVAVDMYLPSFPEIGRVLSASPATVQLTLSLYMASYALGQIVYGPLSDRYGRIPVLRFALFLYCVSSIACAAAPNIELLLTARATQALGTSGAIVIARAIVRDLYSGERAGRELSLMGAIMSLAPVAAPVAGGVLQSAFGWRSHFILQCAVGLIAAYLVWRKLPETLRLRAEGPFSLGSIFRSYGVILRNRAFLAYCGMQTVSFAGIFAWISGSSFVLQEFYRLSAFAYAMAFGAASVGYLVGTATAARIVTRIGINLTIGIGAALLALGGLLAAIVVALGATTAAPLIVAMSIFAIGMGMVQPQTIAGALMPFPERAGAASSLVGLSQMAFAAIVGIAVGHSLGASPWPVALPLALCGLGTLLLWAISRGVRARESATH